MWGVGRGKHCPAGEGLGGVPVDVLQGFRQLRRDGPVGEVPVGPAP